MKKHLALSALAIGIFFAIPDIVGWIRIDRMRPPIRSEMGDQTHYLTHLHRLQVDGRVGDSVFVWERMDKPSRFVFFDPIFKAIPGYKSISPLWWFTILKSVSAITIFIALFYLVRIFGVREAPALGLAIFSIFFYGPYALQGPAISSWFLSLFLTGFAVLAFTAIQGWYGWRLLAASTVLLFASAMHAVYAIAGIGMGALWWAHAFYHERRVRTWLCGVLWAGAAFFVFWALFGTYLGDAFGDPSSNISGVLERTAALRTRHIVFPLLAAKFALAALISVWLYFRERNSRDVSSARRWLIPLFLALPLVAVEVQNVLTGLSYLGDHFLVLEEWLVLPAAAALLFTDNNGQNAESLLTPTSRLGRILGILLIGAAIIFLFSLLAPRPVRSWLVLGRWVPLVGAYLAVGIALASNRLFGMVRRAASTFGVALVVFSVCYAVLFSWRSYVYAEPEHQAAQRFRELFSKLAELSKGVVMVSPDAANLLALYAPHRVYWSPMNGQYGGLHQELVARWLDEAIVFSDDERLLGGVGAFSVFGGPNAWCHTLTERAFYAPLQRLGITDATLCNNNFVEKEWPRLIARHKERLMSLGDEGTEWQPAYKLDWLVVDRNRDTASPVLLKRHFEAVTETGPFVIYRYLRTP